MRTWIPDARFLPYMTWKQVEAIPKSDAMVILPVAAIEQHGHHLPLATDTLENNFLLGRALELLRADLPVYAVERVCYGKSNEHLGFPGTMTLSAATFSGVVRDLGASLHASGFRRLVIYNTHGGNSALVNVLARDLRVEFGLQVFSLFFGAGVALPGLDPHEDMYGYHGGTVETSLLLAATPELVHTDQYTSCYIRQPGETGRLVPENGGATYAWITGDISPSGILGDPSAATAEKGRQWRELMAQGIVEALEEMFAFRNRQQF